MNLLKVIFVVLPITKMDLRTSRAVAAVIFLIVACFFLLSCRLQPVSTCLADNFHLVSFASRSWLYVYNLCNKYTELEEKDID